MNNQLQIFTNEEFGEIRMVEVNGKPYAVGVDIARALEYSNPSKAVIQHCKGITKLGIPSEGGIQETNVIPEGDIYRLIIKAADQSKNLNIKAKAERFESWIFDEVLPTIRKHGAYMTPEKIEEVLMNPDTIIQLATALKEEQQRRLEAERQIEEQKPKVLFAEAWEVSEHSILVGEMAKLLARNGFENMGQNRLFKWLRANGYLHKSGQQYNLPTQKSIELGIIEVKTRTITNPDGSVRVTKTPKITVKGQIYFLEKFKKS